MVLLMRNGGRGSRTWELKVPLTRGEAAPALPRAGWPLAAEVWIPGSSHVRTPPGAPIPPLSFVSTLGGLREAERLAEPPPPPARPGSLGPAAPPRAQHQVARQTWAAGPFASAASAALGSVLPSLSVLPANKGQFDIPKGFGTQGHLSAGAGSSEQLRKRRWSFEADRPGPSEQGVTRTPASVAVWAKPVWTRSAFPRGGGERCRLCPPSRSLEGQRQPHREPLGTESPERGLRWGPGQLRAVDLPAGGGLCVPECKGSQPAQFRCLAGLDTGP